MSEFVGVRDLHAKPSSDNSVDPIGSERAFVAGRLVVAQPQVPDLAVLSRDDEIAALVVHANNYG